MSQHVLESVAQELADATAHPHFLYEVGSDRACKVLDDIQAASTSKPDVDEKWVTVPAEVGEVPRSQAGEPDQPGRRTTAQ